MPDTRIIYIAGFALKKNTGRNKATLEKAGRAAIDPGQKKTSGCMRPLLQKVK